MWKGNKEHVKGTWQSERKSGKLKGKPEKRKEIQKNTRKMKSIKGNLRENKRMIKTTEMITKRINVNWKEIQENQKGYKETLKD